MGHIIITTPSNIITHGQFCKTLPITIIVIVIAYLLPITITNRSALLTLYQMILIIVPIMLFDFYYLEL